MFTKFTVEILALITFLKESLPKIIFTKHFNLRLKLLKYYYEEFSSLPGNLSSKVIKVEVFK